LRTPHQIFKLENEKNFISDDHEPFAKQSVPILHLIPTPFPSIWHTEKDNFEAIDWNLTTDIQIILNIFISTIGVL